MSEYNQGEAPVAATYPENIYTPDQVQLISDRLAQLFRKVDQTDFAKRNDQQERLDFSLRRAEGEIAYFVTHRHNSTAAAVQDETCYILSIEEGASPRLDCILRDGSTEAQIEDAIQNFYMGEERTQKDKDDFRSEIISRQAAARQAKEHEMISAIGHATASMEAATELNELVFYSITRW